MKLVETQHGRDRARREGLTREHIAWVRPDSIGDSVLAAAMLCHVRERFPRARITIVCLSHIADLYTACPHVDQILSFDFVPFVQDEPYRNQVLVALRSLGATTCLSSVYSRSGVTDLVCHAVGAPETIGFLGNLDNMYEESRTRNNAVYTRLVPSGPEHATELERHGLFLAGALGITAPPLQPVLWTTPEDEEFADALFTTAGLAPARTLALFAGAQVNIRLYARYGEALARVAREADLAVIALGAAQDSDINALNLKSCGAARVLNLSGRTTLRRSAALLRRCRLAVGAETGLAHMACAVGTPNVILLGGGHFGRFMPYSGLTSVASLPLECDGCNWVCRYQRNHCVSDVDPALLEAAVVEALARPRELSVRARPRVYVPAPGAWVAGEGRPAQKWPDALVPRDSVELVEVHSGMERSGSRSLARAPGGSDVPEPNREGPMSPNDQYKKAHEHVRAGDVKQAISLLEDLVKSEELFALAHNDLGALHYAQGDKTAAVKHLEQALRLDPSHINAQKNLADLYVELGRPTDAVALLERAVAARPTDTELAEQLAAARSAAPAAKPVAPPAPPAPVAPALTQDEVRTRAEEMVYRQGHQALLAGDLPEAAASFVDVLRSNPNHAPAQNDLGVLHYRESRRLLNLAAHHVLEGLKRSPHYTDGWRTLGELCVSQGHRDEAIAVFERVLSQDPRDDVTRAALEKLGHRPAVPVMAITQMSATPAPGAALSAARRTLDELISAGRIDEAAVVLTDVVRADAEDTVARTQLAQVLYAQAREMTELATNHIRRSVQANPQYSDGWKNLAQISLDRRDNAEAAKCFETILGYDPNDREAREHLDRLREPAQNTSAPAAAGWPR